MSIGKEDLKYLHVWDPEKKQLILNLLVWHNGHSWSMCNGSSSQSGSMDVYFYPGGFSVLASSNSHSREDNFYSGESESGDYSYTSEGFKKDTLSPCLLHVKNTASQQELLQEYKRLKSIRKNCPANPGLYRCLRLLGLSIPLNTDSTQILKLLGAPDKKLLQLPPELSKLSFPYSWQEGSQLWVYNLRPGTYCFFMITENKNRFFYWYCSEDLWIEND